MSQGLINLQNTPDKPGVKSLSARFASEGCRLSGTLFLPMESEGPYPAVIVTGAWTTVKEQMAGTYARELAARGFARAGF